MAVGMTYLRSVQFLLLAAGMAAGEYLGCFEDDGTHRLLSDYRVELKDINSPSKCSYICTRFGYRFAGVQNGIQCFCSNEKPSGGKKRSEAECNTPCPKGNETCGGPLRLAVYAEDLLPPPNTVYMGCYEDTASRLLSDIRFELPEFNTPKKCINICESFGFPYAGLEKGVECFCGKKRPSNRSKKSDSDCNVFCPNSKHKCGGDWRLSVYTYPIDKDSQLNITDDAVERSYLGCFKDNPNRILAEFRIGLHDINSPKKCIYICKQLGFDFAGVQMEKECHCGNDRPALNLKKSDKECSMSCPFSEQKCGGDWHMSVYSAEYT